MKKYGETSTDKWAREMTKSREIVSEIMQFGVSQSQITQIINLLALELEDRDAMLGFINVYKSLQEGNLEIEESASKIILDS
jgi:hypothetical protein|tara:strand:- start:2019 stop:2264 length:246 start_codon:yes stop_codon:yes gene_type:complete